MDALFPEFANGSSLCRYHVTARVSRRGEDALAPPGIAEALEKAAARAACEVVGIWTAAWTEFGVTVAAPTRAVAVEVAEDVIGEACGGRLELDDATWGISPA